MFKKILVILMSLAIVNAQAQVSNKSTLKAAFDELNYSLSVEWDQKDKVFYNSQMEKFTKEVKSLQSEGLSNAELVDFAKSQVKDARVAKELDTVYTMVTLNKMNPDEARNFALETVSKSYSQGANFSSGAGLLIGSILLVAIVAAVIAGGGNVNVNTGGCYDQYVCQDYYDWWGYYLYTDCYYQTYCY
jgi:hypothetical protein